MVDGTAVNSNATNPNTTSVAVRQSNETELTTVAQPVTSVVVTNIRRKREETEPTMPYDLHTMHLPCDFDQNGRAQVIDSFPNHCVWVWNNKYVHEGFFRVFKTYQLEAFFFGQYYERLKRFEIDPHTWDYTNTGV